MDCEFRQLREDEFDAAYKVVCNDVAWMLSKGITQWPRPIPEKVYRRRHATGQNHGLFVGGELAVVVTLMKNHRPAEWSDHLPEKSFTYLATLASDPGHKGQGLGKLAVAKAEDLLRQQGQTMIVLDCCCGVGFLPGYYQSLGYCPLHQMTIDYPTGAVKSVLMCKAL